MFTLTKLKLPAEKRLHWGKNLTWKNKSLLYKCCRRREQQSRVDTWDGMMLNLSDKQEIKAAFNDPANEQ